MLVSGHDPLIHLLLASCGISRLLKDSAWLKSATLAATMTSLLGMGGKSMMGSAMASKLSRILRMAPSLKYSGWSLISSQTQTTGSLECKLTPLKTKQKTCVSHLMFLVVKMTYRLCGM